mgnify:CR=1 FL=1
MEKGMAQTEYLNCSACRWYDGQPYPNCLHVLSDWGNFGGAIGLKMRTLDMRERRGPCGPDGRLFEAR